MVALQLWKLADNYMGEDYSDYYMGPIRTRDSNLVEQSNFEVALEMLGGELEGQVEVMSASHWACGWFEQILVHRNSIRTGILKQIAEALEHYPILDDSDYSDRELEYREEVIRQNYSEFTEVISNWIGREVDDSKELELVISALFDEECGYSSTEEAYINTDTINRSIDNINSELNQLARKGNKLAWELITVQILKDCSNL